MPGTEPTSDIPPRSTFPTADEVTRLLQRWSKGDGKALDHILPLVYRELRKIAGYHFQKEATGHTLQTTALINEVYLQLVKGRKIKFEDRNQFFLYTSQIMRHILVAHARNRMAQKRGGGQSPMVLDEQIALSGNQAVDLPSFIALDQALKRLEEIDPRQVRIVELRFFSGMNNGEIAHALGVSLITVKREWSSARCWLSLQLKQGNGGSS